MLEDEREIVEVLEGLGLGLAVLSEIEIEICLWYLFVFWKIHKKIFQMHNLN